MAAKSKVLLKRFRMLALVFAGILLALLTTQCKKDPVKGWDFYYKPPPPPQIKSLNSVIKNCVPPYPVTFYQETENLLGNVTYEWDFGDGKTSTDQNPNNIYTVPGEYIVRLIVSNEIGADTAYLEMPQLQESSIPVVSDFSYLHFNDNFFAPNKVMFSNNSSGANLFYWHFGDGGQTDNANPENVYQNSGTYTVTLRGTCSDESFHETTRQVFVLPPPQRVYIDSINLMLPSNFNGNRIFIEMWHNAYFVGYTRVISPSSYPIKFRRPNDFPGGYFFDLVQFASNEVFKFIIFRDNGEEHPTFLFEITLSPVDIQNKFYPRTYFEIKHVPPINDLFIDLYINY